jgi:hypothetical protein
MKIKEAAKRFEAYDKRTNKKMAEHNRSGGDVRSPVRSTKGASQGDQYDRAKFIYRKAAQALTAGHPLQDKSGAPTPAAMQFKRWGSKIPKTQADLQGLKALGQRLKDKYKPKEG